MDPFPFPEAVVSDILNWTRQRIEDGPDQNHGAHSKEDLDPVLDG